MNKIFSVTKKTKDNKQYREVQFCGIKCKIKSDLAPNQTYNTQHYLLAMLKAYGLKHAVCSPGAQNATFNFMLQSSNIKSFSVIDERSAAYVANGICNETNEPVIITCTGSSASRNYVSAMSEAYRRKVPLIALTFFDYESTPYSARPQFVDRSVTQNDIKYVSVELPRIFDETGKRRCLTYLNAALSTAFYKHLPVHINCPSFFDFDVEKIKNLPKDIWKNDYCSEDFEHLKDVVSVKKTAIYIGSHKKFTDKEQETLSNFAVSNSIPVFCDHMAHYKGKNRIMIRRPSV